MPRAAVAGAGNTQAAGETEQVATLLAVCGVQSSEPSKANAVTALLTTAARLSMTSNLLVSNEARRVTAEHDAGPRTQ